MLVHNFGRMLGLKRVARIIQITSLVQQIATVFFWGGGDQIKKTFTCRVHDTRMPGMGDHSLGQAQSGYLRSEQLVQKKLIRKIC